MLAVETVQKSGYRTPTAALGVEGPIAGLSYAEAGQGAALP
jgi:hypothetical protein